MNQFASAPLVLALVFVACANAVSADIPEGNSTGGEPSAGSADVGADAGRSGSVGGAGNTGGTASNGGNVSSGGTATSGAPGSAAGSVGAGSGGSAGRAGTGGASSGGMASGGMASGGIASGGTASGGTASAGDCTGIPAFQTGAGSKYAAGAKVVATCNGSTSCLQGTPAGQTGKSYVFDCVDTYNCGGQDPATTNWSTPPWKLSQACQ